METRSNEAWVLLDEWNGRDQITLEFIKVPAVDGLLIALAEAHEQLKTAGCNVMRTLSIRQPRTTWIPPAN